MSRGFGSAGAGDATIFALSAADSRALFGENADAFRFLAITPLERPDLRLAQALRRQQTATVIDIGRDPSAWPALFESLRREPAGLGLRLPEDTAGLPQESPACVSFVVAAGSIRDLPLAWRALPIIAQVCSVAEAEKALGAGAGGLIAKGQESGGRVGDESSFVLLQRVLAMTETLPVRVPVWCQGGMGLHTAAAAIAGGAFGVVLDSVLSGYPECSLPAQLKAQILALDGSEIRTVAGHQVFSPSREATFDELDGAGVAQALAKGDAASEHVLYALGQDAALAQGAMAECANLEALVNTFRHRVSAQLRQARKLRVLDENNAWAASHGTRYPVAQGPMTRVSDTAAFATAVAQAGALPFLALALMQAEPSRRLLDETKAAAGGRPWGVGVLGFAPPEILEPQLQLVREFRPSVLLLAGGRPSQARPFVEMGIPTYLHVPSPGLLDLFLKDGATHFVFEGRECGGHVGPRFSFVLWEQAVSRLLRHKHPERLHILFAGGIHDARSSAMVAAIAAPLAARGAKIGVLMGTAYIATAEAVSCGSILPRFQEKALAGAGTALVETAPGHAIRCLPSGFVDLFEREKNRLREQGVEQRQAWVELETLTVGRLRVASKGLDRIDGVLAPVPAARQEAEGMYMIGQAVALKNSVTTVAELHAQVSRGATEYLAGIEIPALSRAAQAEPVAIVGMACVYPGSPDLESFWGNIVEGGDFVREVPRERWNAELYWHSGPAKAGKTPSKWGGFIDQMSFDPVEFGIPPHSVAAIEPAQLLSLETARRALADAGYGDRWFDREKTAVIFGAEGGMELSHQYSFRNHYPHFMGADLPDALAQSLPVLTEDSFAGVLGNVIAGRIANRLGLGGVNYAVDAACASSLTAIELGVKELRGGSSDMVLAGGADFHNGIDDFLMFASVGALSPTGRCRPFDNQADGIALGEGVGVLVMKRLSDAERDGDRIYAVIDAVAGSSDGKALGLTAPRREGQRRALDRAYWQAGVLPSEIGLMEAHGTGTVVGDRTELETLTEVFNAGGAIPGQTQLGSVKSQIGHTKCAAGIAGVIKVAKALHHRVLPATQQITTPNAAFHGSDSPFRLNRKATPWVAQGDGTPRAAVSAFGFGGTNFHAVLSAHAEGRSDTGTVVFPAELFVLRGTDRADAEATLRGMQKYLAESDAPVRLRDLALSAWSAKDGPIQLAFVATDTSDLSRLIAAALSGTDDSRVHRPGPLGAPDEARPRVAALFGGQGSQYPNMLADLFVYFPGWLADLLAAGESVLPSLFPPTAYDEAARRHQERTLADTRNAQPALGLAEFAAFRWLERLGLRPDMAAGHSYGELVALASAGAFDFADLMRLSRARAQAMTGSLDGDAGLMAAVRLDAATLQPLLESFPGVVIANRNSPIQSVIAGPTADVKAACAFLAGQSVGHKILDTDRAFHSPLMGKARKRFAEALAAQPIAPPRWPVYSNVSAGLHGSPDAIRAALAQHLASPVLFADEIERMYADGARIFVEIGPRQVLAGLVERILKGRPHTVVAIDQSEKGLSGLLDAAARLAVMAPGFDARPLFEGRAEALDLDRPKKLSDTTWLIDGAAARPLHGAHTPRRQPASAAAIAPAGPASPGEDALVAYLSNMREVVRAQRDVLLGYFGAPAERAPAVDPAPARIIEVAASPAPAAPAKGRAAVANVDFEALLLQIIGERTGYPTDKLDADLDLEADLSIDSIKRLEIIGDLADRLDLRERLGKQSDATLERLASLKTLRAMLGVLTEHLPAGQEPAKASISVLLPEIISQCTGYPLDALDPDLDLEADLSIDSIKRIEIIGQLMARLGIEESGDRDVMLEQLSALKTLRAMIGWMDERLGWATPAPPPPLALLKSDGPTWPLRRYVLRQRDADPSAAGAVSLAGLRFVLTDDGLGVARALAAALEARGARPRVVDFRDLDGLGARFGRVDGLVHLRSLNPDSTVGEVKQFFAAARECLMGGAGHLLVAEAGAGHGGGYAGMVKTLSKEFPALRAHWVDLDPSDAPATLGGYIERELLTDEPLTVVGYSAGRRLAQDVVPVELDPRTGDAVMLDRDSVVLLIGGARGITAGLAVALARRYQCRLELAGRSPLPAGPEDEATRDIRDPRQLRQVLLAREPGLRPSDVEARLRRLLAEREIRQTLEQAGLAGSDVHYTQIDVRDEARMAAFIADVYARRGRIDGVIHGAGVVEDKLVRDKTPESFGRVFDTKVAPAMVLRKLIRDDVKFVVFFSSVASAFGNRGQVDYAAANDVLDKLARDWQSRIAGRVLSVNWGPWADTGMVSESLSNDYQRRGIGLIPQREGIDALLRELSAPGREAQVVLMCGNPESFGARPAPAVRAA